MKRYFGLALFLLISACGLSAQVTDTTVCDVLKAPQSFDGKIVRIKGTVVASFDQFIIRDADCGLDVNGIWISYPQGTKGKAGPAAMVMVAPAHNFGGAAAAARTPVTLEKSKDFKQFDNLLSQQHTKGIGLCLGCMQNQVTATLVGRLDGVKSVELKRDASGKLTGTGGFGNLNGYPARLVLQSVSDVASKPEDYSKIDAIAKGQTDNSPNPNAQPTAEVDVFDATAKLATSLGGNALGEQITKVMAVYPKPKTPPANVSYGYGTMNEVGANDGAAGAQDSPDGALYICAFNKDKIKQDAMPLAFIHIGQHVVDLQRPLPSNADAPPPYVLEYNSWVATTEAGLALAQKYITLPGGYVMWNYKWAKEDQVSNMGSALASFMSTEEMMNK